MRASPCRDCWASPTSEERGRAGSRSDGDDDLALRPALVDVAQRVHHLAQGKRRSIAGLTAPVVDIEAASLNGDLGGGSWRDQFEGREIGAIPRGVAGQEAVAGHGGVCPDVEVGQR